MSNTNVNWGVRHSLILDRLIEGLNLAEIKYFILRNYEGLPVTNTSKDVDIIIEPGSYIRASDILKNVLMQFNISNLYIVKYERVRCLYCMAINDDFAIHIDLIEGYLSKGVELFSFNELYDNTIKYKNMMVLNDKYNAVMLIFYKLIGSKMLVDKYRALVSKVYETHSDAIDSILRTKLGCYLARKVSLCLNNEDYGALELLSYDIAKVSKRRAFFRRPIKTTVNKLMFLVEKFHRIIICPTRFRNFIAVQGADGTGKTTFIDALVDKIGHYYVSDASKCNIYHHRPTILPNLGSVGEMTKVMVADKDFTNPHRAKPANYLSSLMRMTYYWLDYVFGTPLLVRKAAQFDKFVIFDRYIYDFLIDPRRTRVNLPYWIRKSFSVLVPQPRIVFILATDAEVIYKRKQELSLDEIKRQLCELKKLAKTNKRFVVLDASQTPNQLVDEAMQIILERFTKKV